MAKKLNSMRLLEVNDVSYEALAYPPEIKDAGEVAEAIGAPYHLVFKTLVAEPARPGGGPLLAVVPSDCQLDLKKLASAAGEKKVQLAKHADAEKYTGLQVGGISALALMHKNWDVYLDSSASELEHIIMSAGQRGTQVRVPTSAFIRLVGARLADIATAED